MVLELGSGRLPQEYWIDADTTKDGKLLVAVYVDDLLLAGRSQETMAKAKTQLRHFLSMETARSSKTGDVWFGQRQYTLDEA